jgi:hypothetical protein
MADLVDPQSFAPHVAAWDHPLVDPNIEDAEIRHKLAALGKLPVLGRVESAYRQRFRLKSWQYMTVVSDELFLAFVVGTAGFASNGFVYAAETKTGVVHERFAITPLMMGTRLAPSSAAGAHRFHTRGLDITIDNLDGGRRFASRIEARTKTGQRLAAELAFASGTDDEHLSLCVPLPGGRWNYTHKFMAFAMSGHVDIGDRRFELRPDRAFGTLDFTKMYALRHAVWRWVALCGRSTRGAVIGLNLVDPTPMAPISENAVWVDGKREAIANVVLTGGDSWTIAADSVDLSMSQVAYVEQKLDVPLVRHKLQHIVGKFTGHVRTASGQIHDLENIIGIAEDNDTWW